MQFDIHYEERTPTELEVVGKIPEYAAGVLFRTGLGPREIETDKNTTYRVNHWFDNLAQVHRFQIHQPDSDHPTVRVTHNSRSTCDGLIAQIRKTGRREALTFGAKYDPCVSFFQKLQSIFLPPPPPKPDEVSISVTLSVNFPGLSSRGAASEKGHDRNHIETLCNKTDATPFQMLDPNTLEPIGIADQSKLHPLLKGPSSGTHAKSDPITGDVFNYNLEHGRRGTYRVFTVSAATGKTAILATIYHSSAYIHSLFLTEHFVILCVWNSFFAAGGASILVTRNIIDALAKFDKSRPATWFVVDRQPPERGGKGLVATYESDAFYSFHTINAYEEPSLTETGKTDIIADLAAYENIDCLKRFYIDNLISDSPTAKPYCDRSNSTCRATLRRFRLASLPETSNKKPLKAASVFSAETGLYSELPTLNAAKITKKHRYVYGVTDTGKSSFFDGIVKYDVETRTHIRWSMLGQTAGEPIFVAGGWWGSPECRVGWHPGKELSTCFGRQNLERGWEGECGWCCGLRVSWDACTSQGSCSPLLMGRV